MTRQSPERPVKSRATRQRAAITKALEHAHGFLSAQELHAVLKQTNERVGLTTVYRTLQSLAETGEVDLLRRSDGEAIYRRCSTSSHHHHLVCESCGVSVEIASQEIERWAQLAAHRHDFTPTSHSAEIYGICKSCAQT
jgi:Fur family transcriptional regulator, ferric uptake regulator